MFVPLEELVRLENPNSAEPGTSFQSIYLDLLDGEPFTSESDDVQAHTLLVEEIPIIEAEETDTSTKPDVYYRLTSVGWVEVTRFDQPALDGLCSTVISGQLVQEDSQNGMITFSQNTAPPNVEESGTLGPECVDDPINLNLNQLLRSPFGFELQEDGTMSLHVEDQQARFQLFSELSDFVRNKQAELFDN